MNCYIWCIALCGAETLTLRKVRQKYSEGLEMCCWRRLCRISWTDRVRNEEVLHTVKEERNILRTVKKKKKRLNVLVTFCVELPSKTCYRRKNIRKDRSYGKTKKKR